MKTLYCLLICIPVLVYSQETKAKKKWNFSGRKHHSYIHVQLGVASSFLRSQYPGNPTFFKSYIANFGFMAGSQFYFKNTDKNLRVCLDVQYFSISGGSFLASGMTLNAGNPGIAMSTIFSNKKSGMDLGINGGFVFAKWESGCIWGPCNYFEGKAMGWNVSPRINFWFGFFMFGVRYEYSKLYHNNFFNVNRGILEVGVRL